VRAPSARRREPARRRRGVRPGRVALLVLALAVAFLLGVGLGKTIDEADVDEGTRTSVRTLTPQQLPPARETVTVTTGAG
jgi:hypothetical protein